MNSMGLWCIMALWVFNACMCHGFTGPVRTHTRACWLHGLFQKNLRQLVARVILSGNWWSFFMAIYVLCDANNRKHITGPHHLCSQWLRRESWLLPYDSHLLQVLLDSVDWKDILIPVEQVWNEQQYFFSGLFSETAVKANSQSSGNGQISNPKHSKPLNGVRWHLEYMTMSTGKTKYANKCG